MKCVFLNALMLGLILMCVGIVVASEVYSEETDHFEQWRQQPSAFKVLVKLNDEPGNVVSPAGATVDGIAEFLLKNPKGAIATMTYDLYFFRDGLLEDVAKSIQLPYVFKQNFAGLNEGTYQLQFLLVRQDGQVGRAEQTVVVKHGQ